ncbi:MAG TPA: DUF3079 domain-containing protein [Polyangiaceae bacterium]
MSKIALNPVHPERICWGCDEHCPADALTCGNGTDRTPHPVELFGSDWLEFARAQGGYTDSLLGEDELRADSPVEPRAAPRVVPASRLVRSASRT